MRWPPGQAGVGQVVLVRGAVAVSAIGQGRGRRRLYDQGRLDGIFGMGGSGGTSIATAAMRTLPVGVPKLVASTVGGGDVSAYAGTKDITFMPSIVDIAGFNRISRRIYANAAAAIAGMVGAEPPVAADAPMIAASMFGNTTAAVDQARARLEQQGYEVLVFHATGTGGRTMEDLVRDGYFHGVLDLTTTELADEVCGGVFSAGPDRGRAAAESGVPVVLVPGCVDMANFDAPQTVPARYAGRNLYKWNPNVTLLRTNAGENTRIGEMLADAANAATGPVAVLLPLRGVSMLDSPGGAFWDPAADRACYQAIRSHLKQSVPVEEIDANVNDLQFAHRAADLLLAMIRENPDQRK
ncbi:MAG: Tm-1-like ATP-binding domain-containing protein [Streptosporangiaceae bacterium]